MGLLVPDGFDSRSARKIVHRPRVEVSKAVTCPRCGLLGHGIDSHFDQHQFAGNKEAFRDEDGNEIGDYNNA
jgi:hypothetical protein